MTQDRRPVLVGVRINNRKKERDIIDKKKQKNTTDCLKKIKIDFI